MPQIGQKWPKFRFFAFDRPPGRCTTLECINERCARARRSQKSWCDRRTRRRTPSFLGKTDFFLQFFTLSRFCRLIVVLGGAGDPSVDHISVIWTSRELIFSHSSSVWLSGQPGIPGFVLARHCFELFRGQKKWNFKIVRSGWNFQISRIASRELGKTKCKKNFFFWSDKNFLIFFSFYFSIYRIVLTERDPQHTTYYWWIKYQ